MKLTPKQHMSIILRLFKPKVVQELKFLDDRMFRFDWAIPSRKVAIEYEGIYSQRKNTSGKSRHTTLSGYSKDTEKYNLAAIDGWIVLRYTAKTYKRLESDLEKLGIHKL